MRPLGMRKYTVVRRQARTGNDQKRVPTAARMSAHDAARLRFNQPCRIDESRDLHQRRGRPDLAEDLAERLRRLLPSANVGQHNPGADHIADGAASFLDCAQYDLEAASGLRTNVADMCVLPSPSSGAAPDNAIQELARTARLKPMVISKGDPEETRW